MKKAELLLVIRKSEVIYEINKYKKPATCLLRATW